jgi:hypothetical protein
VALSVFSIISAPICLLFVALNEVISFIVYGLLAIGNLCISEMDEAKSSGLEAAHHLFIACKVLFAVPLSPVVNAVDFVSRCITTVIPGDGAQEDDEIYGDGYLPGLGSKL